MERLQKLSESYQWVEKIANKTIIEFLKTHDMLDEIHDRFFKQYNVSNTKFNILIVLYKGSKEGMYLSEISQQVLMSNANVTGLIDRLEKQNFVKRYRSDKDRRKIAARITNEGTITVEKIIGNYISWSKTVMGVLEDTEKKQLVELLTKLQKGIIQLQAKSDIELL
ncbi:MAG: MarR family transcriptional regulator [Clostridiaceae bacterium]|nr:MarR family transcriptional regulator [Clostridiaceae bacterium]